MQQDVSNMKSMKWQQHVAFSAVLIKPTTYWLQRSAVDWKNYKVPNGITKMGFGEVICSAAQSASSRGKTCCR
jgi:hypothetical protein